MSDFCEKWMLMINSYITEVIVFGWRKTDVSKIKFVWNGEKFGIHHCFKYLSVRPLHICLLTLVKITLDLDVRLGLLGRLGPTVMLCLCEKWGLIIIYIIREYIYTGKATYWPLEEAAQR